MSTSSPQGGPRWSTRKKLLLQVALLPVLVLCTELVFRGWLAVRGEPYSAAAARGEIEGVAADVNRSVDVYAPPSSAAKIPGGRATQERDARSNRERIAHPFYGWDFPGSQAQVTETAQYFASESAEANYDVLVVGGSVAAMFGNQGSRYLIQFLRADPRLAGRKVRVHSRAFGGCKQPQQLNIVSYLLNLGWKPDAVINLDGFNEVACSAQNTVLRSHPLHPSIPHWGFLATASAPTRETTDLQLDVRGQQLLARDTAASAIRWKVHRSAILGRLTLSRMHRIRHEFGQLSERYGNAIAEKGRSLSLVGPPFEGTFEEAMELVLLTWVESSRSMQAICDVRGITHVHALQPTLHDEGSKPLTPKEIETGTITKIQLAGTEYGYPRMRELGRTMREDGIGFVDTSMVFERTEEALYIDMCHFNLRGQELLAQAISAALLKSMP